VTTSTSDGPVSRPLLPFSVPSVRAKCGSDSLGSGPDLEHELGMLQQPTRLAQSRIGHAWEHGRAQPVLRCLVALYPALHPGGHEAERYEWAEVSTGIGGCGRSGGCKRLSGKTKPSCRGRRLRGDTAMHRNCYPDVALQSALSMIKLELNVSLDYHQNDNRRKSEVCGSTDSGTRDGPHRKWKCRRRWSSRGILGVRCPWLLYIVLDTLVSSGSSVHRPRPE